MTELLTLADGTQINPATGRPVQAVLPGHTVVPTNAEAVEAVTRVRRKLSDLPDIPEKLTAVAVVAAYHMFGLDPWEIAVAMNATEKQVNNMMETASFTDLIAAMRTNVMEGQQEDVRELLVENAKTAARIMTQELMSANGQNRIVAAKDIMDRAGFRPADVVEHRHEINGGLTIEYVKKGGDVDLPAIDITPMEEH